MMKLAKTIGAHVVMGTLLVALAGCQEQEGPAEKAGKEIDKAATKAGQEVEKAGQRIQDAAKGEQK